MYVGNILVWVGFALSARLVWLAPVVGVVLAAEYHAIVRWEEQLLTTRLGEAYSAYAARVPRWLPRLAPSRLGLAPSRLGASSESARSKLGVVFSWRQTLFSERGTFVAIVLGYLLLWTKARF